MLAARPWFAAGLAADAVIGAFVGVHGIAEMRPLRIAEGAFVFAFAAVCSLGPNDVVKSLLIARAAGKSSPRGTSVTVARAGVL